MKSNKIFHKKQLAAAVSVACGMAAGGSGTAYAQDGDMLEEITVTGSRITNRDLDSPSPIMTVGAESFENSANISIESVINKLPQFTPGETSLLGGAADIQSSASNTPGSATLNLRGMGANRNLVLINGRRAQPSNATLAIDINTIPSSAIQKVEIISGGASAVYGADAMTGVINFTLKNDFEGIELDYQTGQTQESDGSENKFSMLLGTNSADGRGNIMIGLDWFRREQVMQRDRDFYINAWMDPDNPGGGFFSVPSYGAGQAQSIVGGANVPNQADVDNLFLSYDPNYVAGTVGANSEFRFNPDGTVFVANGGINYNGPLNCLDCGDYSMIKQLTGGNLEQNVTTGFLSSPMERHSLFMSGDYDITDNISAFLQANYVHSVVSTRGGIPPAVTIWQAPIPRDGRSLPDDLNTLLDARPVLTYCDAAVATCGDAGTNTRATSDATLFGTAVPGTGPNGDWSLYQVLADNGPINTEHTNDVWQVIAGLRGELMGGDWTWEAYASRGETDIIDENFNLPSLQRYSFLVYQPNWGRGTFAPNGPGYLQSGRGYALNCPTGLSVFDQFEPDPQCWAGIDTRMINRSQLSQEIIEANLQGGLGHWFELPAGEVRFSIGSAYRRNDYEFHPGNDGLETIFDNPVGIFSNSSTGGSVDVREAYFELLIPVLENLEVEGGFRHSNYNTAGGANTWKALATWQAHDKITLRGGYQFATRAPNINELFAANTLTVVFHPDQDPCSITTLSPWGNVPSNPDRAQVQALCRAIIGNNTSGFDTNTYNLAAFGFSGPDGFTRQTPTFFPLEIAIFQGNPDLGVEEGRTYTIGTVITDPFEGMFSHDWLDNITLTADFYHIELTDAIAPLSVATVYDNCFNYNGTSNPTYSINDPGGFCQMIRRNPVTGDRAEVDAPFFNQGTFETQGVDVQISWSHEFGPGILGISSIINYLDFFEYQDEPGGVINDATGTLGGPIPAQGGMYDYKTNTTFTYNWNDIFVGLNWRHLPSVRSAAAATNPSTTELGAGSYNIFDLFANYNWGNFSFRVGIDNVLDENQVVVGANPGVDSNTNQTSANYDQLGRRWFAGIKATF